MSAPTNWTSAFIHCLRKELNLWVWKTLLGDMSRSLDLRVSMSHEQEIEVIVQASDEQEWLGHHPTRLDPGKVPSWSSINLLTAGSLGGGGDRWPGQGGGLDLWELKAAAFMEIGC